MLGPVAVFASKGGGSRLGGGWAEWLRSGGRQEAVPHEIRALSQGWGRSSWPTRNPGDKSAFVAQVEPGVGVRAKARPGFHPGYHPGYESGIRTHCLVDVRETIRFDEL